MRVDPLAALAVVVILGSCAYALAIVWLDGRHGPRR